MRPSRCLLPVLTAGAVLAATVSPAAAADPGVGATSGTLDVLAVDAGSLLSVSLLTDRGDASTDPGLGDPSAAAELLALSVSSPALGISQQIPLLSTSSTGAKESAGQGITPIANPVVNGSLLPIQLTAEVAEGIGALSDVSAGIADLDILSGVLDVEGTQVGLASAAGGIQSSSDRGVSLDAVGLLDLESLLAGLGIPLTSLDLDTVLGLVDGLGLTDQLGAALADLGVPLDLGDLSVDGISDALVDLGAGLDDSLELLTALTDTPELCAQAEPLYSGVFDVLEVIGVDAPSVQELCVDVTASADDIALLVPSLEGLLGGALDTVLDALAGQALIAVDGVEARVVTAATDDVTTSVATATGALGGLRVGAIELPALDLLDAADTIDATVGQVESTLDGILGTIDPGLAGLIDIGILESATSVIEAANGVQSDATLTALRIDINPDLAVLEGILAGLGGVDSIGALLGDAGGTLPASPLDQVTGLLAGLPTTGLDLGTGIAPLSEGLSVRIAEVSQRSTFAPLAAATATPTPLNPASTPDLPRTGSNDARFLLLGAAAAAVALGLRRSFGHR